MFKAYRKWCLMVACLWLVNAILTTIVFIQEPSKTTFGIPYIVVPVLNWILVIWWTVFAFLKRV